MTPEQLDKARAEEAWRRSRHPIDGAINPRDAFNVYRELVVSNWTPPDPINPRVLAAREWLKDERPTAYDIDTGGWDNGMDIKAFLAGFDAAVKLAKPLVEYLEDAGQAEKERATYHQAIGGDHEGQ